MKKIIVINLGWEQEPLLDKLSEYDIEIFGIHYDSHYYKKPKYKDVLICDLRDLNKILNFSEKIKPDAVISDECDYSHFAQAVIAEKFKLKGPTIKNAQISSNKYLQRSLAKEKGIKIPNFRLCSSVDEVKDFIRENSLPCIIKPIDNRGSFGVNKISSKEEIEDAYIDALINASSKLVIVEKYIEGIQITIDGYCFQDTGCKSLTIAKKELPIKDTEVAINIYYPADFNEQLFNKFLEINTTVNRKLGYFFGMTHSEYIVYNNDLYLIESANRGGGVYTSEIIVPHVTSIDLLTNYIEDVLDINKSSYKIPTQNSVSLNFFNFPDGVVESIRNIDKVRRHNSILKFNIAIKEGDRIEPVETDANRHGFVIIKNTKPEVVCSQIMDILEIEYDKDTK